LPHGKVMPCPELCDFGDKLIRQCPRRWTARKAHWTDKSFRFRPETVVRSVKRIVLQDWSLLAFKQLERRNQDLTLKISVVGDAEWASEHERYPQRARWRERCRVLAHQADLRRCDPFLLQVVRECANGARAVGSDRG
jgi:hypothetical protein